MKTILATAAALGLATALSLPALAQQLEVPIMVHKADDLDTCTLYGVTGLKLDGDNFLAVRTGPGTEFRKIDEVYNGDQLFGVDTRGNWVGVVYGSEAITCSPVDRSKIYDGPGRKGWVYGKYLKPLAG